jgi:hypothetical protein
VGEGYGSSAKHQAGQATVDWMGLCLLVSLLLAGLLAVIGPRVPGGGLAHSIALRLLCAADLSASCTDSNRLAAAYGPELAAEVEGNAPRIVYEAGMGALPVDFRSCREEACGSGPDSGAVWRSYTGEPTVAFVHVVDCRTAEARAQSAALGYECTGERAGFLYLQYWLYYANSSSLSRVQPIADGVFHAGAFHLDDWEGYQVRVGADRVESRATSHHGYNYDGGPTSWLSDVGITHRSAWGPSTATLYVSGGSHAGHAHEKWTVTVDRVARHGVNLGLDPYAVARRERPPARVVRKFRGLAPRDRWTPASRIVLIPIESLDAAALDTSFAITAPWTKPVYRDPEDQGT